MALSFVVMRALVMVGVMVLAAGVVGCRRRVPRVIVPATSEGLACQRQCMEVFYACQGGRGRNAKVCAVGEQDCLATCPGAMYENGTPAIGSVAQQGPSPIVFQEPPQQIQDAGVAERGEAPAKCVAAELPEWAGASAQRKKELMAECRGE